MKYYSRNLTVYELVALASKPVAVAVHLLVSLPVLVLQTDTYSPCLSLVQFFGHLKNFQITATLL